MGNTNVYSYLLILANILEFSKNKPETVNEMVIYRSKGEQK